MKLMKAQRLPFYTSAWAAMRSVLAGSVSCLPASMVGVVEDISSSLLSQSTFGKMGGEVVFAALRREDRVPIASIGADTRRCSFSPSES